MPTIDTISNFPSAFQQFPWNSHASPILLSQLVTNPQQQVPNFNTDFFGTLHRTNIVFNDIENILPKFNGATHENVDSWFNRFKNIASSFELMEWQKFLFVLRAVDVLAQLHLCSKVSALIYTDLKKLLISKFWQKISAAYVHDLLLSCESCPSELPFEYFLIMKEIASHISLNDTSLMHYVILQISDIPHNKALLYTASEFKDKLQIYSTKARN